MTQTHDENGPKAVNGHLPLEGELSFRKSDQISDPAHGIHAAVEIRIGEGIVGVIAPPRPRFQDDWTIRLIVRDRTEQGWHWTELLSRFAEEEHARFSVQKADGMLRRRYDLFPLEVVGF